MKIVQFFYFKGRLDVYPSQLEDCLLTHQCVNEAVVFGIPVNEYEEEICAWIKLNHSSQELLTQNDIQKFCKGKLAYFRIPK